MSGCPRCNADSPEGARFCPACGAALAAPAPAATERRVVTTLFADLVDYTGLGERHDPEDVDAALRAYFELARSVIEWMGGVVEKYVGDAVVGLFGVPVAHEDDAERAVRAALQIVARMETLPSLGDERLEVRAAVNTGEALVRLHVLPGTAEGILVGDAVNTAARLLAETPAQTVVAGSPTRNATQRAIVYEPLPAVIAKGKKRPVERWAASGAVSRRGVDTEGRGDVPMVGREVPLAILSGLLDRATATGAPQFALVSGEAGIGKSRLLREFFRVVDSRPGELCNWRQGHCPPYGDGVAYWALREIVGAHAGISHDDAPQDVERKLRQACGNGGAEDWLVARLRPLLGLAATTPNAERDESLAAWMRFFEGIARRRPAVVVVEDLHWASEATLEFFLYFIRHATGVPLLLVGTARPEFLETYADVVELTAAVTRIDIKALGPDESLRLASTLTRESSTDVTQRVAETCGGNPLFAEELVRFFQELARSDGGQDSMVGPAAPTSVLSLMAARLDALPRNQRALLRDAAVVGHTFWPGALAAVADREPADILSSLEHLEQREFVRRTSAAGASEPAFSFWHALMRDVAYERIPRLQRAAKHTAVADWLESGRRYGTAESADLLAHHRAAAYELALAAGGPEAAEPLRTPAVRAAAQVAETLFALDPQESERVTRDALELAGRDDPTRGRLLVLLGRCLHCSGRLREAVDAFEDAETGFDAQDRLGLASALIYLSDTLLLLGEPRVIDVADRALSMLGDEPSPELVAALERRAGLHNTQDQPEQARARAEAARLAARQLGIPEPVRAIEMSALANCLLGDVDAGIREAAQLYAILSTPGTHDRTPTSYPLLTEIALVYQGPASALDISLEGQRLAGERHDNTTWTTCRMAEMEDLFFLGRWTGLETALLDLAEQLADRDRLFCLRDVQDFRLALSSLTGVGQGGGLTRSLVEKQGDPYGNPALSFLALALHAQADGRGKDALDSLLLMELHTVTFSSIPSLMLWWSLGMRLALELGSADTAVRLAERLLASRAAPYPAVTTASAVLAEARGDLAGASSHYTVSASAWQGHGVPFEVGQARLGQGRCLAGQERWQEASSALTEACEIFRGLGAGPSLTLAESLCELGRRVARPPESPSQEVANRAQRRRPG